MKKTKGQLFCITGASGAGKDTLAQHLINQGLLVRAVAYTTRTMRPGEVDGVDYHFVHKSKFEQMAEDGLFLEWTNLAGNYYGTCVSPLFQDLTNGKRIVKTLDISGARNILRQFPSELLTFIYIDAGPWDQLEARIRARGPISEEELSWRERRFYTDESKLREVANIIIENKGNVSTAKRSIEFAVHAILNHL